LKGREQGAWGEELRAWGVVICAWSMGRGAIILL